MSAQDFRAGYEAGTRDAIDRCLIERITQDRSADARSHNTAINLCVVAIRALDARQAINRWIPAKPTDQTKSQKAVTTQ